MLAMNTSETELLTLGRREARWWHLEGDRVQCELCSHRCKVPEGKPGICGIRVNEGQKLYTQVYGLATSVHPDPVEKKPLFHFHPGSIVLSFGGVDCNFHCAHCQNFTISQARIGEVPLIHLTEERVLGLARRTGSTGLAWTYNEPTIWYEYTYDACKAAKAHGLYTAFVTNGYMRPEPMAEIASVLDAMNIDVKAFREEFYRKICKARLQPVLEACLQAKRVGIHTELTYLIIPKHNDDPQEIAEFCDWVAREMGDRTPTHFSAFHPDYKMTDLPSTPRSTMEMAYEIAKKRGLVHVYVGNIHGNVHEDTYCGNCSERLIRRVGFTILWNKAKDNRCPACGSSADLVLPAGS